MVGGLYNVFWGKSIEERDDLTKISIIGAIRFAAIRGQ